MHITQSHFTTASSHRLERAQSTTVRVQQGELAPMPLPQAPLLVNLDTSYALDDDYANLDPRYRMLALLLEQMFGKQTLGKAKEAQFHTTHPTPTAPAHASSPIIHYQTSLKERQTQVVEIHANIELEGGERLEASLSLRWEQHFMEKDAFFHPKRTGISRPPRSLTGGDSTPCTHHLCL